ncbi:rhodanese-like domain-containing protein [Bradyrhizobium sp. NP1]|uniref:rhodanese-like domain-containing protein n=1 Tax=Bradyrhizobium sp. NP1 TaxID=3049772 RepID=UPI0025A64578|nr:rhodanese-like domain-containing protein [Bradyrhizobium sp. NP1]WJR76729.1 rhodanese-like domain-containing protein [Bradyrhizobium sp. NP1]
MAGDIDVDALAGLMAERPRSLALFDIREAGEAEQGHIPFATFLPRRLIELRIGELVPSTAQDIVVYDGGEADGRAALAAATLAEFGYRAVRILTGGLGAWRAAGRPVATGVNVPSKRFGEEIHEHDGVESIDSDRLAQMRAAGETFEQWDVRTPAEFGRATLPGSRNVPGVEIVGRATEAAREGSLVVVHCAGRTRGIIAARTLALLGVERVVALENGTMGWRLSGRTLVPGDRVEAPFDDDGAVAGALADASGVLRLSPAEVERRARRHASEPVILVDVRSEEAYLAGHIASSCSRPGGQLIQCTDEVLAVEAVPVILVDDGNGRAAMAAYWLRRMGFSEVALLDGGVPAWRAAGLPLAKRPATVPAWLARLRDTVPSVAPSRLGEASRIVLDVGTSRDFKKGHIPGALWLPRGWLEARLAEISQDGLDFGREIVVTAADESQAILAVATLRRLGHRASWLAGGNAGWVAQGGTLESTEHLPLDLPQDVVDPPYLKGEAGMRAYLDWEIALTGS